MLNYYINVTLILAVIAIICLSYYVCACIHKHFKLKYLEKQYPTLNAREIYDWDFIFFILFMINSLFIVIPILILFSNVFNN